MTDLQCALCRRTFRSEVDVWYSHTGCFGRVYPVPHGYFLYVNPLTWAISVLPVPTAPKVPHIPS